MDFDRWSINSLVNAMFHIYLIFRLISNMCIHMWSGLLLEWKHPWTMHQVPPAQPICWFVYCLWVFTSSLWEAPKIPILKHLKHCESSNVCHILDHHITVTSEYCVVKRTRYLVVSQAASMFFMLIHVMWRSLFAGRSCTLTLVWNTF